MRAKDRYRQAASPRTWLYGIAVNLVRRSRRRLALERALRLAPPPAADPDGRLDLDRAVDALPDRLSAPFLLVKAEGMTAAEAGAVLNLPEGTVRAQVHEAVHRLRADLAPRPCPKEETHYALP